MLQFRKLLPCSKVCGILWKGLLYARLLWNVLDVFWMLLSLYIRNWEIIYSSVVKSCLYEVNKSYHSVETSCEIYYKLSNRANSCALVPQATVSGNSNCSRQLVELVSVIEIAWSITVLWIQQVIVRVAVDSPSYRVVLWIQPSVVRAVDSAEIPFVVCNFVVILHYLLNNLVKEDGLSFTDRSPKNLGGHTVIP